MDYNIVSDDTKKKIIEVIPKNTYIHKDSISHKILKFGQRHVESLNKPRSLKVLHLKDMITEDYSEVTQFGKAILLTHVFDVDLLSIFVLARIWQVQRVDPKIMFCTKPTVEKFLYMYEKMTIQNVLSILRKRGILLASSKYSVLKINSSVFCELESRETVMNKIIEYVNNMDSKIQHLIEMDPYVINNKEKVEDIWTQC